MEFKELFINFAIASIVIFGIFAFIITVQYENNASEKIVDNYIINKSYSSIGEDIGNNINTSESSYISFNQNNPSIDAGNIVISSIVSSGRTFGTMIFGGWNNIVYLGANALGIPKQVYGIIFIIIVLLVIIGLYTLIRVGA